MNPNHDELGRFAEADSASAYAKRVSATANSSGNPKHHAKAAQLHERAMNMYARAGRPDRASYHKERMDKHSGLVKSAAPAPRAATPPSISPSLQSGFGPDDAYAAISGSYYNKKSGKPVEQMQSYITSSEFERKRIPIDSLGDAIYNALPGKHSTTPGPIVVDRAKDGHVDIVDGAHRAMDAMMRGETHIDAWVGKRVDRPDLPKHDWGRQSSTAAPSGMSYNPYSGKWVSNPNATPRMDASSEKATMEQRLRQAQEWKKRGY